MPPKKKLSEFEPGEQLILVLNQLGVATTHLAKSVEALVVYLHKAGPVGGDAGSVIKDVAAAAANIFGKGRRR